MITELHYKFNDRLVPSLSSLLSFDIVLDCSVLMHSYHLVQEFHMTLNVISPETHSAVLEVIESCRIP